MLVKLFRLLSFLPLPALHAIGAALGWLVYLGSPAYRRRLRENISRAGHGRALRAAVAESGKSILELPFVWCAAPDRLLQKTEMTNWEVAQSALDEGHGLIFLTPHLGCFEIAAQAVATGMPITVMYRPPRKAALKPLLEGARARAKLALAPANLTGVRILLKALKRGEPVGLLPDQVPQSGEGVWAEFFGRPAYTMTLPAKLQQLSGAPIILAWAERLPRGRGFRIHLSRLTDPLDGSPAQQARTINAAMEALIARCPAQYFWSYHRYKRPAGADAPPDGAEEST